MKINKLISFIVSVCLLLIVSSCSSVSTKEKPMPEDFAFSITWGAFGSSYYNSETGELIKKQDEQIQTTYFMDEEELEKVFNIFMYYKVHKLPEIIMSGFYHADPPGKYEITLKYNEIEKVVSLPYGASLAETFGLNAKRFENALREVLAVIYESEEWKNLPPAKYLYS